MKKKSQAVSQRRMKRKSQQTIPLKNKTKLINKESQPGKKKLRASLQKVLNVVNVSKKVLKDGVSFLL
ncbi:hypothetical protein ACYSNU_00250 [Enterococcus sp. LJL120]